MSVGLRNTIAAVALVIAAGWAIAAARDVDASSRPVPLVICDVFGAKCDEALRVAWCESRWHTDARNGQYRGLFQMGAAERRKYGHGPDALTQARAAHRYYRDAGGWGPWSCKP